MAMRKGIPSQYGKSKGLKENKNYGVGELDANPFYGDMASEFIGSPYTIMSPHGSAFGIGYLDIDDTNNMADVIEENKNHGGTGKSYKSGKPKGKAK